MDAAERARPYYLPSEIAAILEESGYQAEMKVFGDGRTVILSSAGGIHFSISLYGSDDNQGHITNMQFSSSFCENVTAEQVNAWNRKKRFIKAYADDDGELCLEWDVVVSFVCPAAIRECLEWWEVVLGGVDEL